MKKIISLLFLFAAHPLFSQPLPDTDIFLLDCTYTHNNFKLGKPENITHHPGYENQPFFLPDNHSILFVAYNGNADIFSYDYKSRQFSRKTNTPEDEYSPMIIPGGKGNYSVVRVEKDSAQRLWSFPLDGGSTPVLLSKIAGIGYYEWLDLNADSIALFILGNPNTLQILNLKLGSRDTVTINPGRGFHRYKNKLIFSEAGKGLQEYDLRNGAITKYPVNLPDSVEDFAVTNNGVLLTGKNGRLLKFDPETDKEWTLVKDFKGTSLGSFYRIAVSPDGKKLALVSYSGKRP